MKYSFQSRFASRIESFIEQKNSLGSPYERSSRTLRNFDAFCASDFPEAEELTQELAMAWAVRKPTECSNTFLQRLTPIREFAKYLLRNGEKAYIIPSDLARQTPAQEPYIFSKREILAVWEYFDRLKPTKKSPVRHLVIPMIFRLLYCCGLRPGEARCLRVCDVVLERGRLDIMESKARKGRIVMMADDVTQMMCDYHNAVSAIMPNRTFFFPNPSDNVYADNWLNNAFQNAKNHLGFQAVGGHFPRPYDFRHTFATHRLYQWMKEGKDLNAMLPYLSAYMGHERLSHTFYYIHLVPGMFEEMSGFDFSVTERLLPEVDWDE